MKMVAAWAKRFKVGLIVVNKFGPFRSARVFYELRNDNRSRF